MQTLRRYTLVSHAPSQVVFSTNLPSNLPPTEHEPHCAQAQPARATEADQDAAEPEEEEEALGEDEEGAAALQRAEQYEGDAYRDEEPERPVGPPMSLDAPSVRPLGEAPKTVACMGVPACCRCPGAPGMYGYPYP